jgi:hypothetical protein
MNADFGKFAYQANALSREPRVAEKAWRKFIVG